MSCKELVIFLQILHIWPIIDKITQHIFSLEYYLLPLFTNTEVWKIYGTYLQIKTNFLKSSQLFIALNCLQPNDCRNHLLYFGFSWLCCKMCFSNAVFDNAFSNSVALGVRCSMTKYHISSYLRSFKKDLVRWKKCQIAICYLYTFAVIWNCSVLSKL